jgi:hypothetical protein
MCRGAVSGSSGLMSLDMLPVNESFTPKRFLNDAFVSHPTEYTLDSHAKLEAISVNDSQNSSTNGLTHC